MKLKGITTVERHIEKVVLGVFVAFALAMLVLQLLREPNTTELQGGKRVTPQNASDVVSDIARQVNSQLESQTTPAMPKTPALEQEFVKLLSTGGDEQPMRLVERWGDEADSAIVQQPTGTSGGGDNLYYEPVPPAPTGVTAQVYEGTVDPVEPLRFPELAKLLPAKQPYDARFVSVEGAFDAAALREALKGEAEKEDPLPASWWTGRTEIIDVELVRATVKDDGSMGPEEVIAPLPGRFSMRDRVRDPKLAPKDLTDILEKERANREAIRRPAFYPLISGTAWTPPSVAAAAGATQARPARVDQLVREVENIDREIKRLNDQLNPSAPAGPGGPGGPPPPGGRPPPPPPGGNPDRDGPPPRPSPRGDERADAGTHVEWPEIPSDWLAQGPKGGGSGGGGRDGPSAEEEREAREQRRRKALEDSLEKFRTQRERAVKELEGLGYDDKGQRLKADTPSTSVGSGTPEVMLSVLDQTAATVSVWAHDITAKPGETYRYKLRVSIVNPFFGNASSLADAQKPKAALAGLVSADSEWSDPVSIGPATQFFVTSAREAAASVGGVGRADASADIEVYEFFYGYWRRGSAKLDPGDQVRASIELPELPIFDVRIDEKGTPVVEPKGTADRRRNVSAPTYLLGVSRQAGQASGGVFEVFVREASGRIGIRLPSSDEVSVLRARLAASAEASATAQVATPSTGMSGPGGGMPPPPAGDRDNPGTDSAGRPTG